MINNQRKLYSNRVSLVIETHGITIVNGTPVEGGSDSVVWSGLGSIRYVRPRIQKSDPGDNVGMFEDPVSVIVYLPVEANPTEEMVVVDVDGVLGEPGLKLRQIRKPANVAGVSVNWELYLGVPTNV
jgi:hypothetical protein